MLREIAGHADAVANGRSGLLVDGTPTALGSALARVLSDDALRTRLGAGALEHAARFSWDTTALGIMSALADVATSRR